MQHFARGVVVGGKVVHAEQCHCRQQADLTCAVDVCILRFFSWRSPPGEEYEHR